MSPKFDWGFLATAVLLVVVPLVGLIALVMEARNAHGHDQYGDWKIPGTTTSCCNDQDCAPRRARMSDSGEFWGVWYEGRWLEVPARSVLPMASPDGRSHACIIGATVLCFVPGEVRS